MQSSMTDDLIKLKGVIRMKVQFKTDNAAFEDYKEGEIARILCSIARKIKAGSTSGKVTDINGNAIGEYEV